jgi:UDP-N-acetylmuramyl pentapeptide phosphotransferase/UDP-N-acetylglucosamine-1-phosphate transferase
MIIKVAFQKRLFDEPMELRKIHKKIIPNLGGIAIFSAFVFSSSLFIPHRFLPEGNLMMAAGLVIFMTGLKDDIVGLSPTIKFVAQFFSAIIVAVVADVRIENLQGLFGYFELNYYTSIALTIFFMVGVMNAFNLIDGIDGLAGSLALICSLTYAFLFFKAGATGWFLMSLSLSGGLLGFLYFNITPAKIFMGDSGSLVLGYVGSIFSLKLLSFDSLVNIKVGEFNVNYASGIVLAILIIPIFDTLRVFTLRILKNKSPFTADANHLHHRLLFIGLSHIQATFILALCNLLFIVLALSMQDFSPGETVAAITLVALSANGCLSLYIENYKRRLFSPLKAGTQDDDPKRSSKRPAVEEVLDKYSEN